MTRLSQLSGATLLLLLAAYLRLNHLATRPAWFTDEATHLLIAQQLNHGRVQYLAVQGSWLLFGRLPLFEVLLAGVLRFGIDGMFTLRLLTASLGLITVAVLYRLTLRLTRQRASALSAALALALSPTAVLYSRFGFSYNLLAPLLLIALWALWEAQHANAAKWWALAAGAIGLGSISDLWMLNLWPVLGLWWWRNKCWPWWALGLAGVPLAVYVAVMLWPTPQVFREDVAFTLHRVSALAWPEQIAVWWENFQATFGTLWGAVGLLGLVVGLPKTTRWLAPSFLLIPFVLLGRTVPLYQLSFYYLIPLLPLWALGVGRAVAWGWQTLWQHAQIFKANGLWPSHPPRFASVFVTGLLVSALAGPSLWPQFQGTFATAIDPFLLAPAEARAVAAYVNAHSTPTDVVIASPTIAWLLTAQTADAQMAVAAAGEATVHLPAHLAPERWAFDPRPMCARLIIIDNLWRNWAAPNMPAIAALQTEVEQHWQLTFQAGDIAVYAPAAPPPYCMVHSKS